MSNDKLNRFDEVEVPFSEAKVGDTVTIVGTVSRVGASGQMDVSRGDRKHYVNSNYAEGVTITRLVPKLPKKPEAVGTATVQGVPGVRVMLGRSGRWASATPVGCVYWHNPEHIKDYVPLLDGVE